MGSAGASRAQVGHRRADLFRRRGQRTLARARRRDHLGAAHSANAVCASIQWTTSSEFCSASGTCLCRLTLIALTRQPTASNIRRFMPSRSVRPPHRQRGCTSRTEILDRIRQRGIETAEITLHVGLGTFQPVREEVVEEHKLHREWYEICEDAAERIQRARDAGRRVVAVGTTTVRTLEFAARQNKDGRIDSAKRRSRHLHLSRLRVPRRWAPC